VRLRARRHRCRVLLLLVLSLLFQQVAMAAYACPLEQAPQRMEAMSAHCAGMDMQQVRDNPVLCAKHCAPDLATAADHVLLTVPASLLPPTGLPPVLRVLSHHQGTHALVPIAQSDPPPRLKFCSLLI
jgi:hypothetical protein